MYAAAFIRQPAGLQNRFCYRKNVRNNRSFSICYARTTLKQQCVSIYGPKMYNNLQTEVKSAQNVSILKNRFKKLL